MTTKINIKDEDSQYNIDDILKTYKKYLDKDFIKLLKKLKQSKPDTITDEEKEMIVNNCIFYDGISSSIRDIMDNIEDEEIN